MRLFGGSLFVVALLAVVSISDGRADALEIAREVQLAAAWKKVDDAFWEKFLAVKSGNEMAVKSCYEK
jgi:hypothetical protein